MIAKKPTIKKLPRKRKEIKVKINLWRVIIAIIIFMFLAPVVVSVIQMQVDGAQIEISQAMADIKDNKVKEITIQDDKLLLTYTNDDVKVTTKEKDISFTELLESYDIQPADVNYLISDQTIGKTTLTISPKILAID